MTGCGMRVVDETDRREASKLRPRRAIGPNETGSWRAMLTRRVTDRRKLGLQRPFRLVGQPPLHRAEPTAGRDVATPRLAPQRHRRGKFFAGGCVGRDVFLIGLRADPDRDHRACREQHRVAGDRPPASVCCHERSCHERRRAASEERAEFARECEAGKAALRWEQFGEVGRRWLIASWSTSWRYFADQKADGGCRDGASGCPGQNLDDGRFPSSQLVQAAAASDYCKHCRLKKIAAEGTCYRSDQAVS